MGIELEFGSIKIYDLMHVRLRLPLRKEATERGLRWRAGK